MVASIKHPTWSYWCWYLWIELLLKCDWTICMSCCQSQQLVENPIRCSKHWLHGLNGITKDSSQANHFKSPSIVHGHSLLCWIFFTSSSKSKHSSLYLANMFINSTVLLLTPLIGLVSPTIPYKFLHLIRHHKHKEKNQSMQKRVKSFDPIIFWNTIWLYLCIENFDNIDGLPRSLVLLCYRWAFWKHLWEVWWRDHHIFGVLFIKRL